MALFNVVAEGNNKRHSIKRVYVSHNTFSLEIQNQHTVTNHSEHEALLLSGDLFH